MAEKGSGGSREFEIWRRWWEPSRGRKKKGEVDINNLGADLRDCAPTVGFLGRTYPRGYVVGSGNNRCGWGEGPAVDVFFALQPLL